MGFSSTNLEALTQSLGQVDATLAKHCPFDKKTGELLHFELSIKARSKPRVRKHYRGSVNAGASSQEIAYVFALTMREAAGADDCRTHSIVGDLVEAETSGGRGSCG
jgi:alkylhydroperoxidase/carboxymuconolactone decarboxylase family protein YurZ